MVQKKKLVRDVPGSKQWQRKQPGYKAPEPAPLTSPVWEKGKGGLTAQQAQQDVNFQRFQAPLRQGSLEQLRAQPQAPKDLSMFQKFNEFLRTGGDKIEGFVEKAGLGGGETPSNLDIALAAGGVTGLGKIASAGLRKAAQAVGLTKFSPAVGRILTIKETRTLRAINRLSTRSGNSVNVLSEMVHKATLNKEVLSIIKSSSPLSFAKSIGKLGLKGAGTALGADILLVWYALDNIIGGQKFYLKDVRGGVADGSIPPEEAQEALTESQEAVELAQTFATKSAELNPAFYPIQKVIKAGVKADERAIELTTQQIEALIAGQQAQAEQAAAFPEPASFEEHVQQQEFIRRAEQQPTALDGGRR